MRGFGLFVAVFSVGLVLFMLLTGQLSEFFIADEDPFREEKLEAESDGLNHFRFPYVDPKTRRKAFDLTGIIESDSPIDFESSPLARTDLSNVEMAMFVYDDVDGAESVRVVDIKAGRAEVKPTADVVELLDGIVCNDPEGTSFRTASVKITLPEGQLQRSTPSDGGRRTIQIEGRERVDLDHGGFLELASDRGFESEIDPDRGFRGLTIQPPVYVAVDPDRSGGFVGLPSGPAADSDPATPESRVHVIGDGPLEIRTADEALADGTEIHTAIFRGGVTIFVAPGGTGLDSEIPVPIERLRCDELEMELAVVEGRATLRRATARRGADPLSLTRVLSQSNENDTSDVYELLCTAIQWDNASDEAHIIDDDGRITVRGPTGTFSAAKAWFENRESRLRLEDLRAELSLESFGLVGDAASRLADRWSIEALRGSLRFEEPEDGTQGTRRFFEAFGTPKQPVVFAEKRENGIELQGVRVSYDDRADTVRLERADGFRPVFREGPSRLIANAIEVQSGDENEPTTNATFDGDVKGTVHGPTFTRWSPDVTTKRAGEVEDATAEFEAESLKLTWSEVAVPATETSKKPRTAIELTRVEAAGGAGKSTTIRGRSLDRLSNASGDRIVWTRADGVLSISGEDHDQQIEWEGSARVTARALEVDSTANEIRATDRVVAVIDGQSLPRASAPDGSETVRSDVQITADGVRVGFEPKEDATATSPGGDDSKTGKTETREFRWRDATANGSPVEVRDAEFHVRASEIEWRSEISEIEAPNSDDDESPDVWAEPRVRETLIARGSDAPGLQRPSFRYVSEDGESFGFSKSIRVVERENGGGYDVAFDGDVEFDISERTLFRKRNEAPPETTGDRARLDEQRLRRWQLRSPRLEAVLVRAVQTSELAKNELTLESIDGPKGVEVRSPQHGVRVTGTELSFRGGTGRLVLGGERNSGTQRLERVREAGSVDHITSDEIVLSTHPDQDRGANQRVIAYFDKVLRASFAHDSAEKRPEVGNVLEAGSDHMIVILDEPVPNASGSDAPGSQIREAVMWGDVNFTSGRYRGLASEARYTRRDRRVSFFGSENDPPTLYSGRDEALRPETFSLEWKPDGSFRYIEENSRKPMNRSELQRILEQADRAGAFREAEKTKS